MSLKRSLPTPSNCTSGDMLPVRGPPPVPQGTRQSAYIPQTVTA